MIEGTALAIVLQTFDSPNLSLFCLQYAALPARLTEHTGRERLGESNVCKTMAGAVPSITDICSLGKSLSSSKIGTFC